MFKKLFILAIPVMVMTACTSEEDVKVPNNAPKEISFTGVNKAISRNALDLNDETAGNFKTTDKMIVSAILTPTATPVTHHVFFEDAPFKHNGKTGDESMWIGETQRYFYPYDGTLQFMAYSTAITAGESTTSATNTDNRKPAVWSYTTDKAAFDKVEIDFNNTLAGTEDLLYSSKVLTQDAAATIPTSKTFAFKHALALLTFKVKGSDAASAAMIKVKDIKVNGVSLSGVLTVTNTGGTCSAAWTSPIVSGDHSIPGTPAAGVALPTDLTSADFGTGLLVINQKPGSFTVTYDMTVGSTTYAGLTKTVNFDTSSIDSWATGSKYVYTITLSPKEITFTGTVDKTWAGGGTKDETI